MANSRIFQREASGTNLQDELRESQAHLSGIIASAMDAIITIDENQNIRLFNAAAERMFGYRAEDMMGRSLHLLLPERYRALHAKHIHHFGETGTTNRTMGHLGKLYGQRSSGEEFPIEASISQVNTGKGRLFTVILRDITERVAAEEKLLENERKLMEDIAARKLAETALQSKTEELKNMTQQLWQTAKLATMGELAASIAHELNNPLAILSLRVESLMTRIPEGGPERRELDIMVEEIDRMAVLVSNLLQFSRSGQRQISSLLVQDEINQTLELIHNYLANRRVTVQREFAPDTILIQADRQQMRQLFLNLFTNAADAMPGGGVLTIRTAADGEKKNMRVDIIDSGVGISPEVMPHVMEPFYTTKANGKGTGLGLAICRRIVEDHKGSLTLTSPGKDQGTSVHIVLPASSDTYHPFFDE